MTDAGTSSVRTVRPLAVAVALALPVLAASARAATPVPLQVVARTDDPVPGRPGEKFVFLFAPNISQTGRVVFESQGSFDLFHGTPGALQPLVFAGDPVPDAPDGTTFTFPAGSTSEVPINRLGDVAFHATYQYQGGPQQWGGFTTVGGPLDSAVLRGDPLPGQPNAGAFDSFSANPNPVVLSDTGTIAFHATIPNGGANGTTYITGIWASNGPAKPPAYVAATTNQAAGYAANSTYSSIAFPVMNASGTIAFSATVFGTGVPVGQGSAIYTGTPGNLVPVLKSGTIAPGTGVKFAGNFGQVDIAASGKIAFRSFLEFPASPLDQREGIWAGDPAALSLVARAGSQAPGLAAGTKFYSFAEPFVTSAGRVSFAGQVAVGGSPTDYGIWTGTQPADLTLVARTGGDVPGLPGVTFGSSFAPLYNHVLNDLGQIAFVSYLAGAGVTAGVNDTALFAWDPAYGLKVLVRAGDSLPVGGGVNKTVQLISIQGGTSSGDGRATSLNDAGVLGFQVSFANEIYNAIYLADLGGTARLPGDADHNGLVDAADLRILYSHLGQPGTADDGDFDGDGAVSFGDLQLLELNFGRTSQFYDLSHATGAAAMGVDGVPSSAVPEPGALSPLALAALTPLLRRRRAAPSR